MNVEENAAFLKLGAEIDKLNDSHEHLKSLNATQATEIESLKAQLAAVPPAPASVPDDTAAITAVVAKVDAELGADAPPPVVTPTA